MTGFLEKVFDDSFILGFGKPRRLIFNSCVKDMMPTFWEKKDDNYVGVCKTIGINPEDVLVEEIECGLKVSGSTETNGNIYDTLRLPDETMRECTSSTCPCPYYSVLPELFERAKKTVPLQV